MGGFCSRLSILPIAFRRRRGIFFKMGNFSGRGFSLKRGGVVFSEMGNIMGRVGVFFGGPWGFFFGQPQISYKLPTHIVFGRAASRNWRYTSHVFCMIYQNNSARCLKPSGPWEGGLFPLIVKQFALDYFIVMGLAFWVYFGPVLVV